MTTSMTSAAPVRELDVLGRLLLALQRETDIRDLIGSMDFWATGRGGFVLEWWEGPYADELHRELIAQLVDGGSRLLGPQDFTTRTDVDHRDVQHRLFLLIRGVPVEFRSCDAVGLAHARATNSARRLRALQHTE